jgi:membrane protein implicated in regulation of membrane protease activity
MDTLNSILPWVFGGIALAGVVYFIYNTFLGGDSDLGGDAGVDLGGDLGSETGQFGCSVIAAFMAAFGAIGVLGLLSGWNLLATLGVALGIGILGARVVYSVLRFVVRQQSTATTRIEDLIGATARITIDTPAGKVGEAMIEGQYVEKHAIREESGEALVRGDEVEITDIEGTVLRVRKKRM